MGLIEKQVRKHANQKLAAPVVTGTSLSQAEVTAAIRSFCNDVNSRIDARLAANEAARAKPRKFTSAPVPEILHYYVEITDQAVLVSWQVPPHMILQMAKRKQNLKHGWWLASVQFPKTVDGLPAGQIGVQLTLLRWMVDGNNGKMKNRNLYESFSDALAAALRRQPIEPGAQATSG